VPARLSLFPRNGGTRRPEPRLHPTLRLLGDGAAGCAHRSSGHHLLLSPLPCPLPKGHESADSGGVGRLGPRGSPLAARPRVRGLASLASGAHHLVGAGRRTGSPSSRPLFDGRRTRGPVGTAGLRRRADESGGAGRRGPGAPRRLPLADVLRAHALPGAGLDCPGDARACRTRLATGPPEHPGEGGVSLGGASRRRVRSGPRRGTRSAFRRGVLLELAVPRGAGVEARRSRAPRFDSR